MTLLRISAPRKSWASIFLRNASFIASYDLPCSASFCFSSYSLAEAVLRSRGGSSSSRQVLSTNSLNIGLRPWGSCICRLASWRITRLVDQLSRAWAAIMLMSCALLLADIRAGPLRSPPAAGRRPRSARRCVMISSPTAAARRVAKGRSLGGSRLQLDAVDVVAGLLHRRVGGRRLGGRGGAAGAGGGLGRARIGGEGSGLGGGAGAGSAGGAGTGRAAGGARRRRIGRRRGPAGVGGSSAPGPGSGDRRAGRSGDRRAIGRGRRRPSAGRRRPTAGRPGVGRRPGPGSPGADRLGDGAAGRRPSAGGRGRVGPSGRGRPSRAGSAGRPGGRIGPSVGGGGRAGPAAARAGRPRADRPEASRRPGRTGSRIGSTGRIGGSGVSETGPGDRRAGGRSPAGPSRSGWSATAAEAGADRPGEPEVPLIVSPSEGSGARPDRRQPARVGRRPGPGRPGRSRPGPRRRAPRRRDGPWRSSVPILREPGRPRELPSSGGVRSGGGIPDDRDGPTVGPGARSFAARRPPALGRGG